MKGEQGERWFDNYTLGEYCFLISFTVHDLQVNHDSLVDGIKVIQKQFNEICAPNLLR
jgi:hypothetical protein